MDITTEKQQARSRAIAQRKAIPADVKAEKSRLICGKLCTYLDNLMYDSMIMGGTGVIKYPTMNIAVYAALASEVNLGGFIEHAYSKNMKLSFPCMNLEGPEGWPMYMREVTQEDYARGEVPFIKTPIRAFEPQSRQLDWFPIITPKKLDMIVVPLVAFDKEGYRMGYGGGNYDSYLPHLGPHCHVVGVAFAEQQLDELPREVHDCKLPTIFYA